MALPQRMIFLTIETAEIAAAAGRSALATTPRRRYRAGMAIPIQACVRCGAPMADIKGSRLAVCRRCGYKDDCC